MQVGIITMFHNSSNYGGILQSYALVRLLERKGISAEQIRYDLFSAFNVKRRLKQKIRPYYRIIKDSANAKTYHQIFKRKKIVVDAANRLVKHSKRIYTEKSISQCQENYSTFVTGSDQVWHGEWPAYFLTFVPSSKIKISYAASTGKSNLSEDELKMICEYAKDFTAISVREADTALQLKEKMLGKDIELVLDPTLLLDREEWEKITSQRRISGAYVFCYFLGSDLRMRKLAKDYAVKHGYVVVTIPHMQDKIETNDLSFGDVQSFDATPQDFLSYIKNAEAVFTDSFHASVFSQIFERQYYVFGRLEHMEMNNRIITLTEMFGTRNHFIEEVDQYQVDYIEELKDINYNITNDKYGKMKKKSIGFLEKTLKR